MYKQMLIPRYNSKKRKRLKDKFTVIGIIKFLGMFQNRLEILANVTSLTLKFQMQLHRGLTMLMINQACCEKL